MCECVCVYVCVFVYIAHLKLSKIISIFMFGLHLPLSPLSS